MLKQSSSRVQLKNIMLKNNQTLMTTNSPKERETKEFTGVDVLEKDVLEEEP